MRFTKYICFKARVETTTPKIAGVEIGRTSRTPETEAVFDSGVGVGACEALVQARGSNEENK